MVIEGTIERIFPSNRFGLDYGELRIRTNDLDLRYPNGSKIKDGDVVGIMAKKLPSAGETLRFDGEFSQKSSFRPSVTVKSIIEVGGEKNPFPLLLEVKGIGKTTAGKIVKKVGKNCIEKIIKDPNILHELGLERFQDKIEAMYSEKITTEGFDELIGEGLSPRQIGILTRLAEKDVLLEFQKNPYFFVVPGELPFGTIDAIARRKYHIPMRADIRLEGAAVSVMKNLSSSGSTYFEVSEVMERFQSVTKIQETAVIRKTIERLLQKQILWMKIQKETGEKVVGFVESLEKELFIAKELLRLSRNQTKISIEAAIQKQEALSGFSLADSQKEAVEKAINNQVFVMTGGPGTGKSATSSTIK